MKSIVVPQKTLAVLAALAVLAVLTILWSNRTTEEDIRRSFHYLTESAKGMEGEVLDWTLKESTAPNTEYEGTILTAGISKLGNPIARRWTLEYRDGTWWVRGYDYKLPGFDWEINRNVDLEAKSYINQVVWQ
jgi:hypothetical protein